MNIDSDAADHVLDKPTKEAHVFNSEGRRKSTRSALGAYKRTKPQVPVNKSAEIFDQAAATPLRNSTKHRHFHSSSERFFKQIKKMKTDNEDNVETTKSESERKESAEELGKKGKKGKKDKHKSSDVHGIKGSKASSFVRKLNLGKYMSSPSGSRRAEPVRSVSVEFESDASDKQSSASSSLTPTSVKRHTPEGEDGAVVEISVSQMSIADTDDIGSRSTLSEEGVNTTMTGPQTYTQDTSVLDAHQRLHEPVSTKPYAISAWKEVNPVKLQKNTVQSREEPIRKRIAWVNQLSEDKEEFMEKNLTGNFDQITVRRHSGGDEINTERNRSDTLSILKVQELKAEGILEEPSTSVSPLPRAEEDRTESAEETESGTASGATPDMPAFGDLIMDTSSSQQANITSNLTQSNLERKEHLYKILVIGELGTGKTSIIKRYVHQFFSQHYRATIGVDFALKVLNWDANTIIRLQLWDIAGQERFGNMTRVYYKDAVGAFIVFDVTRVATFDAVVKWKQDLDSKVQLPDGSPIPCVLLGNKCDQQKEGIVNTPSRMEEFCKEKGFSGWFETSAKENINIEDAARFLVNKILVNDKLLHSSEANKDNERIAIDGRGVNGQTTNTGSKTCSC